MQIENEEIDCPKQIILLQQMLELAGIWPRKRNLKMSIFKLLLNWTVLPGAILCLTMELYKVGGNINRVIEVLMSLLQFVIVLVKLSSVTIKRECFCQLLKHLNIIISGKYEGYNEEEIMNATIVCNKIVKFFGSITLSVILFYTFFPVIDKKALPMPFSYNLGDYYYLMHFLQCLMLVIAGLTGNSIDALYVTLATFAAAEIEILCNNLLVCVPVIKEQIAVEKEGWIFNNIVKNNLLKCIELHTAITRFVYNIDSMFSFAILVQYVLDMVHICSLLVQLFFLLEVHSTQFVLVIVFLVAILTQLSFYHWFGNAIIDKSNKIGNSLYMSTWYECDTNNMKIMSILLERTKRPLTITVYKFTSVSLASFTIVKIIRWSYSLFAVLQGTMRKNK